MMERSSRFISLSGWSGISAGICALVGAAVGSRRIEAYYFDYSDSGNCPACLRSELLWIAAIVFVVAFSTAFLFTWLKSKRDGAAIWGVSSRRLLWNTLLPMAAGAVLIWRMIELKEYGMVAPASLIFYGLALINGSKYTMGEIRYLGYAQLATGIAGLWLERSGLYLWALGFGILHIIYGIAMWWKYDRRKNA